MRISTEFISSISAPAISTSFDFHDLGMKRWFSDVYRFMSRHICRSLSALNVKSDHRSKFSNLSNWKDEEA